jgi:hypothetical protein
MTKNSSSEEEDKAHNGGEEGGETLVEVIPASSEYLFHNLWKHYGINTYRNPIRN